VNLTIGHRLGGELLKLAGFSLETVGKTRCSKKLGSARRRSWANWEALAKERNK